MASASVQIIKASPNLRQRAMRSRKGRSVVLESELRKRIDEIFSVADDDFQAEAMLLLAKLNAEIAELNRKPENLDRLITIGDTAGELRGMGGMFNFPLITALAKCLIDLMEGVDTLHPSLIRILELNSAAIACVLRNNIRGQGGRIESDVVADLGDAKVRIRDRHCIQHLRRVTDATERLSGRAAHPGALPGAGSPRWSRLKMAAMSGGQPAAIGAA